MHYQSYFGHALAPDDPAVNACRIKYAAFLYDAWLPAHGRAKALAMACFEAKVSAQALRTYLPAHHRRQRVLRNWNILKMRSWGYSPELIAQSYDLNRATVGRVITDYKDRMNAIEKCERYKIRGRLKHGDPRRDGLPLPVNKAAAVNAALFRPSQSPAPRPEQCRY